MKTPRDIGSSVTKIWSATNVIDETNQLAQFVGVLRRRYLTWFMNFIENHIRTKDKIK
jgi:hypothetical protein